MNLSIEEESFTNICDSIRNSGKALFPGEGYSRVVFTSGRFDILHPGHLKLLNKCRSMAGPKGVVVVGVASDKSIKATMDNQYPIIGEDLRCLSLVHLRMVDHVITYDSQTPEELIKTLKPDIIVAGSDSKGKRIGESLAPTIFIESDEKFNTKEILKKIGYGK